MLPSSNFEIWCTFLILIFVLAILLNFIVKGFPDGELKIEDKIKNEDEKLIRETVAKTKEQLKELGEVPIPKEYIELRNIIDSV